MEPYCIGHRHRAIMHLYANVILAIATKEGTLMHDFSNWLVRNTALSSSSVYKYSHAVATISREMLSFGIIFQPIESMNLIELDIAIAHIFAASLFIEKNKTGNSMYSNALKHFRAFRKDQADVIETEYVNQHSSLIHLSETERLELVKSRIGQGLFRTRVLSRYSNHCLITGIDNPRLLVASHIKPWASATNEERLNPNNGLCLSPTYDRLFDIGLITFKDSGEIIVSSHLSRQNRLRLGLAVPRSVELLLNDELGHNLEYHRDTVFVK